ncbi:hypothetical protein HYG81_07990 [Natrinema zhouii]|uniref:DUF8159 domain-containing protein n=1 Tax=Natrinema zhouii TaxID=1710539 RepID=A0A7D6CT65_9EURY|nr:hypothetical protein [Natrinema zhouii]QLK27530.1 hypothetical protein HYG81_07990 [Natrinema zhouii]
MTDDPASTPSRRRVLGAAAGTALTAATAGCLGSLLGTNSSNLIEPEEPSDPPDGTPGEFYYFLEDHDIEVDRLARGDDELYLTYRSDATDVEESNEEITVIYEIYKQALIHRGSDIEFLYTEISNPFDEQAHGWGIDTEWIHQFDSTADGGDDLETDNETVGNQTAGNESAGNETNGSGSGTAIDMNRFSLWNNIMNSKVYGEDVEADGNDVSLDDPNGTVDDSDGADDETVANESGD